MDDDPGETQSELSAARAGGGPTRKLLHLAMTVAPVAAWWIGYQVALALVAIELGGSVLVEVARRRWGWVNRLLWTLLPTTFRSWEGRKVLGSTWFGVGAMAALLLFGRDVGGTALLYLVWGDPAAELVGRRWGRPGVRKTVAGSAACLAACLLAGLVGMGLGGLSPWATIAGALMATVAERWSPPPDDNVWVPLAGGLTILGVEAVVSMFG